jgi:hypothetical protein
MADPGEMLAFKNDLMQLVVFCQFKEFRPRVRLCLENYFIGLETILGVPGDQVDDKLLSRFGSELPSLPNPLLPLDRARYPEEDRCE